MACSTCGAVPQGTEKFCLNCGTRLADACPNCGAPTQAGARFCGECGTQLGGDRTVEPVPVETPVGPAAGAKSGGSERRLVSVLFADLVDFTTLSEDMDPEATRDLLTRYFEAARETVARYGGTLEKFIGDAVMAVWGTPTTHEDDAERAVRAALDLVETVPGVGSAAGLETLAARAAVVTGEAAVTVGAEGQGMVAGDLVNTASRLQGAAEPGSVLVGQGTRDAANVAIAFEPAGDRKLKGKSLDVPAWRALRVIARVGGAGRYEGLEPPFEGRDDELRLLKDLFHASSRERKARLVTLIGQAGTGKSRLIREFEKYTDGMVEDTYWHTGRSPSYGEGITFWALGEMVRKRAGLAETDDERTTRERISSTVEEFVPDESERKWIEPALLQLLGLEEGRSGQREELFAAWRTFFERIAAKGPTVLVFEDLEFADAGLLDFIDHLVEWSRGHPIFVIAPTRPELLERRPGWGAGQRNFAAIGLEPLTDQAMRSLLEGVVPGLPDTAIRAILSRAEGVPLYAVETVRMLLNTGRLAGEDGRYRVVGDVTELEIPNTLRALIAARLDALDAADRSVLQDAAVLGQTFALDALVGTTGESAAALEPRLRSLVRREVLVLDVDPRSPERGQYGFVQGLVREVAYSTLSKRDRKSRHLAAARYFESLGDEEIAGALAMHYFDAWRASAGGSEGDTLAAQARIALRAAADRAARLHSYGQALAFLEHGLSVTDDRVERAEMMEHAGAAAAAGADDPLAKRYWNEAIETYRAVGDDDATARTTAALGLVIGLGGAMDEAIALLSEAYQRLGDQQDKPGVVRLTNALARVYALSRVNAALAVELADRAIVSAERLDLVDLIADAIITKGVSVGVSSRTREALILLAGALALAEARGMGIAELRARINISQYAISDDPRYAYDIARVGVERAQRLGERNREATLAGNACFAALVTGDWDWAIAMAPTILRDQPLRPSTMEVAMYPALMKAFRGDTTGADDQMALISEVARLTTDPQYAYSVDMAERIYALARNDPAAALSTMPTDLLDPTYASKANEMAGHAALWLHNLPAAQKALSNLDALELHGQLVDATRRGLAAGIAALEGRTTDAVGEFGEACRQLREMGLLLPLALTQLDLLATLSPGAEPARAAAEEEARAILTRLGATSLMERLEATISPSSAPDARAAAEVPVPATEGSVARG